MIKTTRFRIACDPRGKIKSGEKSERGYPKALDYFNVSKFPELEEMYGEKPSSIYLYFPSDTITDFFDCEFNSYGNDTKKRSCDGESCVHRMAEEVSGMKYVAGEQTPCVCSALPPDHKQRCKYVAYLRGWIVSPKSGRIENHLCYLFETHSQNSGDAILTELDKIRFLNKGILRGVKFELKVKMVSSRDNVQKKFPIWSLLAIGSVSEIQEKSTKLLTTSK